ncbi:MAG: acyltransferase family protein [Rhodoluna sp.]
MTSNLVPVGSRSTSFRADIQGLRAIAIILVIALHLNLAGFSAGFIGVDIFFVVSGYVITLSIQKKPAKQIIRNLVDFWRARFVRIFPVAALVICVTVIAAFLFSGKAFNPDIFDDARWATLYGTNFRLINTGSNYFITGLDQSLLTHYWALAVEQQFYLVYPILVFGLSWLSSEKFRSILLRTFLVLVIAASSYWSITQTLLDPVASYFSPFTRFWELAFGGLLATFATTNKFRFAGLAGLAILLGSMFLLNSQSSYPGYLAWLPVLGTGLLLWAPVRLLGVGPLRYIGDISYSLYLWHFLWLVLPTQIESPITDPNYSWLFLIGAIGCAVMTYHFFERPIHRSATLKTDSYSALTIALSSLAGAWLCIALIENLWLRSIL